MDTEHRLELILEAAKYCRSVKAKGMPASGYAKALREPIHFLWEKRNGTSKAAAAKYRSLKAKGLRFGGGQLRYDHAIPFGYVMKEILEAEELDLDVLRKILEEKIVICLITKEEDARLKMLGLNSKMPETWDGEDPLARYKAAKIKIEENA